MNDGSPPSSKRVDWRSLLRIVSVVAAVLILALTLAILFISSSPFWEGRASGIYWLENPPSGVATGFMIAFLASLLWLAIALPGWLIRSFEARSFARAFGVVGATLAFVGMMLLAPISLGVSRSHMDGLRAGGQVYLLADQQKQVGWRNVLCDPPPPVDPYSCTEWIYDHQGLLFECGALGLICHRVYATEPSRDGYALALGLDADTCEILLLDSAGDVVGRYAP